MKNNKQTSRGLSRRTFLGTSAVALGSAGLTGLSMASPLRRKGPSRDALITVYLRGALEGMTAVVPYADPDYAPLRQSLAIGAPGQGADAALDLDGFFGLHPAGAALLRPYADGRLAFVHASGIDAPNRSHFDAQQRMESATDQSIAFPGSTGWVGRHLASTAPTGSGLVRGIGISNLLPLTLVGAPGVLPVSDIGSYDFPGRAVSRDSRASVLTTAYESGPPLLAQGGASTLSAIELLESIDYASYTPEPGANYPSTDFGDGLRQVAALIKAGIDLETAQVDVGGWDHHADMLPRFQAGFTELSQALDAFYVDMQNAPQGYTLLTHTEFGRRGAPNGSDGTDHGYASCMMAMGTGVVGGRVVADWPGLGAGNLVNGDLNVTTDWRDVAAEALDVRMGGTDLASVFPGYTPTLRGLFI